MKIAEENDALWKLLGRASRRKASPFFARKVARAASESPAPRFRWNTFWPWAVPASAFAALVLGWSVQIAAPEPTVAEFNDYFDTAADLQSLVATEDVASWIAQGN